VGSSSSNPASGTDGSSNPVETIMIRISPAAEIDTVGVSTVGAQALPDRLGRYRVLETIGEGGMGRVFRAHDPELDRELAIKVFKAMPDAAGRLLREAQAMACLHHPNVIGVFDVAHHADAVFIAMEYIEGNTLRRWLGQRRRSVHEVIEKFLDAGDGLAAAHRAGLVHRDFKPNNVMVGSSGRGSAREHVWVMDFGLARASESWSAAVSEIPGRASEPAPILSTPLTHAGSVMGTPAYMSPEELNGAVPSAQGDQYAFCIALYEALWGSRPFSAPSFEQLYELKEAGPPEPPDRPKVPRRVRRAILRGLAPDPRRRWPSMDALLSELRRANEARGRRWAWTLAAGSLALALGLSQTHAWGEPVCADPQQELAGIWDAERASQVEEALTRSGLSYAADTAARVRHRLDAHVERWSGEFSEACAATRVREEQPSQVMDARMHCLKEGRRELAAVVEMLAQADAEVVPKAVSLVTKLPHPTRCADEDYVLGGVAPPDDPELARQVASVRELLAQALALETAGKYAQGVEVARDAKAQAEQLEYEPVLVDARLRLGGLLHFDGALSEAETELQQAFFDARRLHMDEGAAGAATTLAGVVGYSLGRYDDGLTWTEHARAAMAGVDDPRLRGLLENQIALVHQVHGTYDQARDHLVRALEIVNSAAEADEEVVGRTWHNLGIVQHSRGDYDASLEAFNRALEVRIALLGPEHPEIAATFNGIAAIHYARGDLQGALERYQRALALFEQSLAPEHASVASLLNNIGVIHFELREHDQAGECGMRALEAAERGLGADHPTVAVAANNLGNVWYVQGKFEEARRMHRRALEIRERQASEHPGVADALSNLANDDLALGDLQAAARGHQRALEIRRAALGPDHDAVSGSLHNLANVDLHLEEFERSRRRFGESLAIRERALGPVHSATTRSRIGLGRALLGLGRLDEAREMLEAALVPEVAAPLTALSRAEAQFALARVLWRLGERPRALELARGVATRSTVEPGEDTELRQSARQWLALHQAR
jgi:eukaryotic-like serine/threonine-protein kinase